MGGEEVMRFFEKWTEEEWDALIEWCLKMGYFWLISCLLYVTIFYKSTIAAWVLGSLTVLKAYDMWREKQDEDNGHEATK